MKSLVSVIVLSYKNLCGLYETIDSILQQTYENIELIISDDGTPGFQEELSKILDYIQTYKKEQITNVIINALPENVGTVKNINSAIRKANGQYIKLISAEDCLTSETVLSKYVAFMEENDYLIAFAKMRGVTPEGEYKYVLASCESDYDLLKGYNIDQTLNRLFQRDFLPAPATFFDRKLFEQYGLFKEDVRLIEDYPYWIYLTMNKVPFGYIDEVLIDYKLSSSGAGVYSEMFMNDMFVIYENYIFPYDKRFGIFQPIYNGLKYAGLKFYMSQARWHKMNTAEKIMAKITYFPFYVYVGLQNIAVNLKNHKK